MPIFSLLAAVGLLIFTGAPSISTLPEQPRSTPKKRQEKIALPLPVKAAEANNLACPYGQ